MADKKKQDHQTYWCTCNDSTRECFGCAIEKLILEHLGPRALKFLHNRIYRSIKK